jgi:hypothetical protein
LLALTRLRSERGQQNRLKAAARGLLARRTGSAYGAPSSAPVASPCFPGSNTRAIIFNAARMPSPAPREPSASGPRRLIANACGLRRPGSSNITASCVRTRLLHCHGACFPTLALGRGHAPRQIAGILHSNCAARLKRNSRFRLPRTPAHPLSATTPSIPKGSAREEKTAGPSRSSGPFPLCSLCAIRHVPSPSQGRFTGASRGAL